MKIFVLMSLCVLVSCNYQVDARKAGITGSQSVCGQLTSSIGTTAYCPLAAELTDIHAQGTGTDLDPYVVCSPYQLNAISDTALEMDKAYRLGADLDMSCIAGNHEPIGSITRPYSGNFDGQKHTISNWVHVDPTVDYVGLFSYISGTTTVIKDLSLLNARVHGKDYVGILNGYSTGALLHNIRTTGTVDGITYVGGVAGRSNGSVQMLRSSAIVEGTSYVGGIAGLTGQSEIASAAFSGSVRAAGNFAGGITGYTWGTIYNSYNAGNIIAAGMNAGGLTGYTINNIENSFSTGGVAGLTKVGGLVGEAVDQGNGSAPLVRNSFMTGVVSANGGTAADVGTLVGVQGGSVTNSYFLSTSQCDADVGTVGIQACGSVGVSTRAPLAAFYNSNNAPLSSWDFQGDATDGRNDFWVERTNGAPIAWYEAPEPFIAAFTGRGTEYDPYIINNETDFNRIGSNQRYAGASFRLENDLDFTMTPFVQVASGASIFFGTFDGDHNRINGVTLERTNSMAGVFGIGHGTKISNLRIRAADISSTKLYAGVLIGANSGSISNCSTEGLLTSYFYSGGLVGFHIGSIENSWSQVTIPSVSSASAGGLVGAMVGTIDSSFALSDVTGAANTGGLVGSMISGSINDSFARGNIVASVGGFPQAYGGLVGFLRGNSTITNSYSTGSLIGKLQTGGLVGRTEAGTTISHSFTTAASITGTSTSAQVGHLVGASLGTITNSYYLATATCDAHAVTVGVQVCNTTATGTTAAFSDYFNQLTPPLDQWSFFGVWYSDGASLPVPQWY